VRNPKQSLPLLSFVFGLYENYVIASDGAAGAWQSKPTSHTSGLPRSLTIARNDVMAAFSHNLTHLSVTGYHGIP
jgi:hypothetical protein